MSSPVRQGVTLSAWPRHRRPQWFVHVRGLVSVCRIVGTQHLPAIGIMNAAVTGSITLPPPGHAAKSLEETPLCVSSVTLGSSGLGLSLPICKVGEGRPKAPPALAG